MAFEIWATAVGRLHGHLYWGLDEHCWHVCYKWESENQATPWSFQSNKHFGARGKMKTFRPIPSWLPSSGHIALYFWTKPLNHDYRNDALGYFLWARCQLALAGKMPFTGEHLKLCGALGIEKPGDVPRFQLRMEHETNTLHARHSLFLGFQRVSTILLVVQDFATIHSMSPMSFFCGRHILFDSLDLLNSRWV